MAATHSLLAIDGLVGYWRFDEGSGDVATDASGLGNDGQIISPEAAWIQDPNRGQVYASGNGSYVDFGSILPVFTLDSEFSWAFWVNASETDNNNIVLGNRYMADGADFDPREFVKFTPRTFEWHVNGAGENVPGTDTMFVVGEWAHNVVVKSGNMLTYYRDGVELATSEITSAPTYAQPFYLGGGANAVENFSGLFDEVAVFNRALSAAEVTEIYELGDALESLHVAADDPNLGTPAAEVNLGQVAAIPQVRSGHVVLRNTGSENELTISSIIVSGSDADHFSVDVELPLTIGPREQVSVEFQFDALGQAGGFHARMEIESNDASDPLKIVDLGASIINRQGPLAHYRMDESVGDMAMRDASGYGRDGVYMANTGTLTLEAEGLVDERALQVIDGAHAIVDPSQFDRFESFTVTMWIAGETMAADLQTLVGRGFGVPSFAVLVASGGLQWIQGNDVTPILATDAELLQTGETYHIAIMADQSQEVSEVALFINGVEAARNADVSLEPDEAEYPTVIGAFNGTLGFNGRIDDVQIYDRALNPDQIAGLYENPGDTLSETGDIDSDGDGLSDAREAAVGSDPLVADTDRDGLSDGVEVNTHGTSPILPDTDGDGVNDRFEVFQGSDPTDAMSVPTVQGVDGLVGYWRFEEGAGAIAEDQSGGGHNGQILNPSAAWEDDPIRGTVYRSGNGSYVDFGDVLPVIDLEQGFTWSFWVRADETSNNNIVLGNRYMSDGNDFDPREFIKFTPTTFEWHVDGAGQNMPADFTPLVVGEWNHQVVVKAGDALTYYRDGAIIAESTLSSVPVNPQPFYLGGQPAVGGGVAENFSGLVDEVAVFERALSEEEVLNVYQLGLSGQGLLGATTPGGGGDEDPGDVMVTRTPDQVVLRFPDSVGMDVEFSTDLETWTPIGSAVEGRFHDADEARVRLAKGFYRGVVK